LDILKESQLPSSAAPSPAPLPANTFGLVLRESRQQVVTQFTHTCRNELNAENKTPTLRRFGAWIGDQPPETIAKIVRALQLADALNLGDEAIHWIDLPVAHLLSFVSPELEDRHRAALDAKGPAN